MSAICQNSIEALHLSSQVWAGRRLEILQQASVDDAGKSPAPASPPRTCSSVTTFMQQGIYRDLHISRHRNSSSLTTTPKFGVGHSPYCPRPFRLPEGRRATRIGDGTPLHESRKRAFPFSGRARGEYLLQDPSQAIVSDHASVQIKMCYLNEATRSTCPTLGRQTRTPDLIPMILATFLGSL